MEDPLDVYLREIGSVVRLEPNEEIALLSKARAGTEGAMREYILQLLPFTAEVAFASKYPSWMGELDRVQEANVVLLTLAGRNDVTDVRASLRLWVPYILRLIERRGQGARGPLPPLSGPFPPEE